MNDESILPERGRVDADVDVPNARPAAAGHDEWVIDGSIEETFPASDPTTPVQPGSLASERYSQSAVLHDARAARVNAGVVLAAALSAAAIGFIAGLVLARRGLLQTFR
jgi:hypothetical protein